MFLVAWHPDSPHAVAPSLALRVGGSSSPIIIMSWHHVLFASCCGERRGKALSCLPCACCVDGGGRGCVVCVGNTTCLSYVHFFPWTSCYYVYIFIYLFSYVFRVVVSKGTARSLSIFFLLPLRPCPRRRCFRNI